MCSDVLERAKAAQLKQAQEATFFIRLSFLQELIAEIERLRIIARAAELLEKPDDA